MTIVFFLLDIDVSRLTNVWSLSPLDTKVPEFDYGWLLPATVTYINKHEPSTVLSYSQAKN